MSIRSLDLGEIGTLLYADVRDAAIAVGWGPIHVSWTRAGWRVAAGGYQVGGRPVCFSCSLRAQQARIERARRGWR